MKLIFAFLTLMIGSSSTLCASVKTDTHTYFVIEREDKILAIDRKTGSKTKISVGINPVCMVIHNNRGFVVNKRSNNISVIDLRTNKVIKTIDVNNGPTCMVIHNERGYVVNNGSHDISVIDLRRNTVINTIDEDIYPQCMVIHNDMGYVVNDGMEIISVIDLKDRRVFDIKIELEVKSILIHGEVGYVLCWGSVGIFVIDLSTNRVIKTIKVDAPNPCMVIHNEVGYLISRYRTAISVLDLKRNIITQTISFNNYPRSMVPYGEVGYVVCSADSLNSLNNVIYVVDLRTYKIISSILKFKEFRQIDVSDTHVYYNAKKLRRHYPTPELVEKCLKDKNIDILLGKKSDVLKIGEIEPRIVPDNSTFIDLMSVEEAILALENFENNLTAYLTFLLMLKNPERLLTSEEWQSRIKPMIYIQFFQAVWGKEKAKAQQMILDLVRLEDPLISSFAEYRFVLNAGSKDGMQDALD